jgi:cytochrome c biogenesis protein CcmG, thiol:disulfide interchange protein DsbE
VQNHVISHPARTLPASLLTALVLVACGGSDDGAGNPESELSAEEATAPLTGAPPPLVAIRDEANELLDGGADAFDRRLEELRGTPVVVNKWASWCGPCRLEFPFFQSQAAERGAEIAFLGVDSNDSEAAARDFLEQLPLPYPSYVDPDSKIAAELKAPVAFPATAFYDRSGELVYTHAGPYTEDSDLAADINRYAIGAGGGTGR